MFRQIHSRVKFNSLLAGILATCALLISFYETPVSTAESKRPALSAHGLLTADSQPSVIKEMNDTAAAWLADLGSAPLIPPKLKAAPVPMPLQGPSNLGYSCLPSCAPDVLPNLQNQAGNDSRMFVLAGTQLATFVGGAVTLGLRSTAFDGGSIEIGVFDGDAAGLWDRGNLPLTISLYADPNADGVKDTLITTWASNTQIDNGWSQHLVSNHPAAQDGVFFTYILELSVSSADAQLPLNAEGRNAFKVRTNRTIYLLENQIINIAAAALGKAELQVIHPNYPSPAMSTYDGTFTFNLNVPPGATRLDIWNGDADTGGFIWDNTGTVKTTFSCCANQDTDDDNTPNALPPFSSFLGSSVKPEGVATGPGQPPGVGYPSDDNQFASYRRSIPNGVPADEAAGTHYMKGPGGVRFRIVDPNGTTVYTDNNPSGTEEWERLLIVSEDDLEDDDADHVVATPNLTEGTWQLIIEGLDVHNYVSLRVNTQFVGTSASTFSIGDTVFFDNNANGLYEPESEDGIDGITLNLLIDANNDGTCEPDIIETTVTSGGGQYLFDKLLDGKTYCVTVANPPANTVQTFGDNKDAPGYNEIDDYSKVAPFVGMIQGTDIVVADFGYVNGTAFCPPNGIPGEQVPGGGGTIFYSVVMNPPPDPGNPLGESYVYVRFTQPPEVNDNAYGSTNGPNSTMDGTAQNVGWNPPHPFSSLVGSDFAEFRFVAPGGTTTQLQFRLDYLSSGFNTALYPSGHHSLGPAGDGGMVEGSANALLDWNTSLSKNLNGDYFDPITMTIKKVCNAGVCKVNEPGKKEHDLLIFSPRVQPDPSAPWDYVFFPDTPEILKAWNFDNYYEVRVKLSALAGGFGSVQIVKTHNSPVKAGGENYTPVPCPTPSAATITKTSARGKKK